MEAMTLCEENDFKIILTDMFIGEENHGLDFVQHLRSSSTCKTTPIIMVTAHAYGADRNKALESGCDVFLAKPLSKAQLLTAIWSLKIG